MKNELTSMVVDSKNSAFEKCFKSACKFETKALDRCLSFKLTGRFKLSLEHFKMNCMFLRDFKMRNNSKFENGILLPKLFWPTVRKNCSTDREKLLKFEAEGENLQNFWDH